VLSPPRLCTSATNTKGSTVICSGTTNALPGTSRKATDSPKKRPVTTPRTRPSRTLAERDMGLEV
jgi:hypothetical protein